MRTASFIASMASTPVGPFGFRKHVVLAEVVRCATMCEGDALIVGQTTETGTMVRGPVNAYSGRPAIGNIVMIAI